MNSPVPMYGGKGRLRKWIIKYFPKHDYYVEPFGGGAWMLFEKERSKIEVYNDLNHALYDFFNVISDTKKFKKFQRKISVLPSSRQLFNEYNNTWENETDDVDRITKWFYVMRHSFSGQFGSGWKHDIKSVSGKLPRTVVCWLSAIRNLDEVHKRLMSVSIENQDFRKILKTYNTNDYLCYADPPYYPDSRKTTNNYKHELSTKDHEELIDLLKQYNGMVVLSGYVNDLYKTLENDGWEREDYVTVCHASLKSGVGDGHESHKRTESIWLNPSLIAKLISDKSNLINMDRENKNA